MPKQPETGRTAAIMRSSSTTRIRSRGRVELGRLALGCFALRRNLADVYCIGHSGGVAYKAPHSRERKRGTQFWSASLSPLRCGRIMLLGRGKPVAFIVDDQPGFALTLSIIYKKRVSRRAPSRSRVTLCKFFAYRLPTPAHQRCRDDTIVGFRSCNPSPRTLPNAR